MTLTTWWLFVAMSCVVSATPGPNMLLVMVSGARHGFRMSIAAMAGCLTALILMLSISAAGVGALLQAFPAVFNALRLAGAAYLIYLGIQQWRAPVVEAAEHHLEPAARDRTAGRLYRRGFLVAASNPKAILFAAAFFPQFIHADAPQWPQFTILLATFVVIELAWYAIYAAGGQRLSAYLRRASIMKAFNRLTGGVFVGFALLMARP